MYVRGESNRRSAPSRRTTSTVQIKGAAGQSQQVIEGLGQGWNLISFQVLPSAPTPENVLAGLSSDPSVAVLSLWCYDAALESWLSWTPGGDLSSVPGVGILEVNYFRGYWIELGEPNLTLTISGDAPPDGRVPFEAGWNLLGFPASGENEGSLSEIEAIFRGFIRPETGDPADPHVDLIYSFDLVGNLLRWDFTLDRLEGDFNADGAVNAADDQLQNDFGFPDDIPGLVEVNPNADDFAVLLSGEGYWVHARRPFTLEPFLRILVASDSDEPPLNNFPGPEDIDLDGDGTLDGGAWTSPDPLTDDVQSIIFFPAGKKAAQVVVNNAGTGILKWQAEFIPSGPSSGLSSQALTFDLTEGETLTDTDNINLTVDRTGLAPGVYEGIFRLTSNGGTRELTAMIEVPEILGDFEGIASIETVNGEFIEMPSIDLAVTFFRSPDGSIRGQIHNDLSAHFPIPISLQGAQLTEGSTDFVAVASYSLPKNAILVRTPNSDEYSIEQGPDGDELFNVNTINPFPRPVFREIVLIGGRTEEDVTLEGDFFDTLIGVTADPIVLKGSFRLSRSQLEPTLLPMAGRDTPCPILLASNQVIPEGSEKLFALDGVLGCPAITEPVLIEDLAVYAGFDHPNPDQLRIRLLAPSEDEMDPAAGVLLYDGQLAGAPSLFFPDLSWPRLFSDALQALFPQQGPDALRTAYRGRRADEGGGVWRLGITDQLVDGSAGLLRQWTIAFSGPRGHDLAGRVVDVTGGAAVPLAEAAVTLSGAEVLTTIVTGSDGRFVFKDLAEHRYRIRVSRPGFEFDSVMPAPADPSDPLRVDLTSDIDLGDVALRLATPAIADLLIQPAEGRIGRNPDGSPIPFTSRVRYVAPSLTAGDTYQYLLQRYERDPLELNPGEAGFVGSAQPPLPVGPQILVPLSPSVEPLVEFQLAEAGVYSVTAVVFRASTEIDRVGESEPRALEQFTLRIEDALAGGSSGGNAIVLAGAVFAGGGVVPFDFYPPDSDTTDEPAPFIPVMAGNPATRDFFYRALPGDSPTQNRIRLGEDMAIAVSVDLNRPEGRSDFSGPPWDPNTDPWRVNNPSPVGTDLNVSEPSLASPTNDYGRGIVTGVGIVAYDLLPGDNLPGPVDCPAPTPDQPDRCFIITTSIGSVISGSSLGSGFQLTGGARLGLLSGRTP